MITALRWAALATMAVAGWLSVNAPPAARDAVSEQIGTVLDAYRPLTTILPPTGRIGFLPATDDSTLNSAHHYAAQYALAPRLVVGGVDGRARFVITGLDAAVSLDYHRRLAGYELVAVGAPGIRVYRRIPR